MSQLLVSDVTLSFGGIRALSGVNLAIEEESITSIIGPNGAGKTSLLNCISGFYHPTKGNILLNPSSSSTPSSTSVNIANESPHAVAKLGIARAFQNIELFSGLSVLDNLMLARHRLLKYNFLQAAFFWGKASRVEAENRKHVEEIIDFMELEPYRKHLVGTLSYGVQKRVEVARALTMVPQLLLLDEPMAGMNVEEKEDMVRFITDIRIEKKITVVLIEHDLGVVMDISDKVYVLDFGQVIGEGTPEEVSQNPDVIKAYIGEDH